MNTEKPNLESIITFSILMENNGGILSKAESYIREKWSICIKYGAGPEVLDEENQAKYTQWFKTWTR